MRAVRDFILIICAVISTSCLVYFVYHAELFKYQLGKPSALMNLLPESSESTLLKRLKEPKQ